MSTAEVSTHRRRELLGGVLLVIGAASCDPSRDTAAPGPVETAVVELPPPSGDSDAALSPTSASANDSTADQGTTESTAPSPATTSGASVDASLRTDASLQVPFGDFFDVDPLGTEPVRGSGCGLHAAIGDEMPDGLWRGYVRSFDGLWVDGATSLEFDLACVYTGNAGVDAEQAWRTAHPGETPADVPDGFLVNDNDRVRTVPLGAAFVQVDAQWNDAGHCLPPPALPPSGETQAYRLLDSWLLIDGGEARWVVTSCLPR